MPAGGSGATQLIGGGTFREPGPWNGHPPWGWVSPACSCSGSPVGVGGPVPGLRARRASPSREEDGPGGGHREEGPWYSEWGVVVLQASPWAAEAQPQAWRRAEGELRGEGGLWACWLAPHFY